MPASPASDLDRDFIHAVRNGETQTVQRLIAQGANINAAEKYGQTALMIAAELGHTEIARLLVEQGANIHPVSNYYGYTALLWAARGGHADILRLLIAHGASVNASSDEPFSSKM